MTMTMYQADRNFVSPANDASLYSAMVNDTNGTLNRGNKLNVTANGLTATVDTGQALIQGRLVEVISAESITLPANTSGKIVVTVDLTKQNDVSGNVGNSNYSVTVNQAYISVITSGTLTQDDLNNGGYIYQLPIASFASTATSTTVHNIASIFSDTGWLPLSLPDKATDNGGSGWAQYRIKNNMMMISFYNINCKDTDNGNQVIVIPSASLQPVGDNMRYFSIHNYDANTGYAWPAMAVVQSKGNGTMVYAQWDYNQVKYLTGATGTIQYPIG